jgi:hypothetical protein
MIPGVSDASRDARQSPTGESMTIYQHALFAHSWLRWIVLLLAILVLLRSMHGWWSGRIWTSLDEQLHVALTGSVDLQFLVGILLYFVLSPLPRAFYQGFSASMTEPILRFYGVEHALGMFAAVAIIHIGRKRSQKAPLVAVRHRRVFTWTLAALLIMGASIPWPELLYGRPLFRAWG